MKIFQKLLPITLLTSTCFFAACNGSENPVEPTAPVVTFAQNNYLFTLPDDATATISGTIVSNVPLQSYVLYQVTGNTETDISTKFTQETSVDFSCTFSPTTLTTGFKVVAVNQSGLRTTTTVPVSVTNSSTPPPPPTGSVDAFPGAEGFGRYTTGGRGGKVIYVTNLNDEGTGSLRAAVMQSGARIVLFKVSGTIELKSNLKITNPNITIAGQSAPGDGICLKNYTLQVAANNVILRYLRFRPGDYVVSISSQAEPDAAEGQNVSDVIIDHCSMSWSIDELSSWYSNTNFSLQWCLLYESLKNSGHSKGAHGYTGLWGGNKASFHHNLVAHSDSRNPRLAHPVIEEVKTPSFTPGIIDIRNNIFYNWGSNSGYGGEGRSANFVNNYYKPGLSTSSTRKTQIFEPYWTSEDAHSGTYSTTMAYKASPLGTFYANGNYMDGSASVTADNWAGFAKPKDGAGGYYKINSSTAITAKNATAEQIAAMKKTTPFDITNGNVTTQTATDVYNLVLEKAGVSLWRNNAYWYDAADARVILSVKNSTGNVIDKPSDVGGYPTLAQTTAPLDTDGDGMPDDWEDANGLNKNEAADGAKYTLSTIYTNVEMYLNSLVKP